MFLAKKLVQPKKSLMVWPDVCDVLAMSFADVSKHLGCLWCAFFLAPSCIKISCSYWASHQLLGSWQFWEGQCLMFSSVCKQALCCWGEQTKDNSSQGCHPPPGHPASPLWGPRSKGLPPAAALPSLPGQAQGNDVLARKRIRNDSVKMRSCEYQ